MLFNCLKTRLQSINIESLLRSIVTMCDSVLKIQTTQKSVILIEFSLKVFPEFSKFSDKNICRYSKTTRICY